MTKQKKTNDLFYLIGPKFSKVNRLFVLSFKNEENTSFSEHCTPEVEIKDCNVLIGGKSIFDVSIKNKKETYE